MSRRAVVEEVCADGSLQHLGVVQNDNSKVLETTVGFIPEQHEL